MGRKAYLIDKYRRSADHRPSGQDVGDVIQKISNFNSTLPSAPLDDGQGQDVPWPRSDYAENGEEDDDGVTVDWLTPSKKLSKMDKYAPPHVQRHLKPQYLASGPKPPPRPSKLSIDRQFPLTSPAGILRPVHIAGDLVEKFIAAARENTERKNI